MNERTPFTFKKHLPGLGGLAVLLLAVVETVNAVSAPARAPSEADWQAASQTIRSAFRPGDLIVAAPAWADPVMRLHLGDLVSVDMATRLDAAAYGRVWEVTQRGARAPEATGRVVFESRHGNLTVRRLERTPAEVKFDFVAAWQQARVSRQAGGAEVPCALGPDRIQCPDFGWNSVKPAVLEIDFGLREALYAQPVGGANLVISYDDVPMGRRLTVAAGLHHVWLRKAGEGKVNLEVFVGDRSLGRIQVGNRSAWSPHDFDTTDFVGQRQMVKFIISTDNPFSRHFGFAAEARS